MVADGGPITSSLPKAQRYQSAVSVPRQSPWSTDSFNVDGGPLCLRRKDDGNLILPVTVSVSLRFALTITVFNSCIVGCPEPAEGLQMADPSP